MLRRLRKRTSLLVPLYVAFGTGFVLGAAMMASPALAIVIAAIFLIDILRRHL